VESTDVIRKLDEPITRRDKIQYEKTLKSCQSECSLQLYVMVKTRLITTENQWM
jgi:hypothetical protein